MIFTYIDEKPLLRLSKFMSKSDGFSEITTNALEHKAENDFKTIREWLPSRVNSVLDIGCGLAAVDILIARYCKTTVINLMDGDGTGHRKTGFNDNTKAWCDRRLAKDFVAVNVSCSVRGFNPNPSLTIRSDLIISLKSWGHHYPVSTYIELVKRSLRVNGRVIMDIRKEQGDGLQTMKDAGFDCLGKTYETIKCERFVFCRN